MCGIAGIFAHHQAAPDVERAELRCIRDHMTARGPAEIVDQPRAGFQTPVRDWLERLPVARAVVASRGHWARRWARRVMALFDNPLGET